MRLTVIEIPYSVEPCISGLRIFGTGTGERPDVPEFAVCRSEDELDLLVVVEGKKDLIQG